MITATRSRPEAPHVRRRARIVPDQHGAWGFLLLPVALAAAASGWASSTTVVAGAWVAAYPFTWALAGRLTAGGRRERFRRPLLLWSALALPLMAWSVLLVPWIAAVGALYGALFAINLAFARQRRERSLANDLVFVAECTLAVPVLACVSECPDPSGTPPWACAADGQVFLAAVLCALTLAGSTLHVTSMIRERRDPRYAQASRVLAAASVSVVAAAAGLVGANPAVAAPFVLLAGRAVFLHRPDWRPARLGLIELGCFAAVALVGAVTLR